MNNEPIQSGGIVKYQLKTITPVHIGTGETLSQIDGFYDNGRWHRIDIDAVLAAIPESDLNRLTHCHGAARLSMGWIPSNESAISVLHPPVPRRPTGNRNPRGDQRRIQVPDDSRQQHQRRDPHRTAVGFH